VVKNSNTTQTKVRGGEAGQIKNVRNRIIKRVYLHIRGKKPDKISAVVHE